MASLATLSREERIGLGIAAAAHVALVAALVWQVRAHPAKLPMPERITVSLAQDVALTSTAPQPAKAAQAAIAPQLAPVPAPPSPPEPIPTVHVKEQATPPLPALHQPAPKPVPTAALAPAKSVAVKPAIAKPAPAKLAPAKPTPPPKPAKAAGGSRLGDDFLAGVSAGERTKAAGTPAAAFGPAEAASLNQAISRQIKPHWQAPQGADAELLVTLVRFRLNQDGSLAGAPTCVGQSGETPSNAAQKNLHCERAVRAVQLAAPFDLPGQFYDKWKLITSRFDRRL